MYVKINNSALNSHMMKNDEWGAVAYLSKSKYGKQNEEVWINNSSSYITGSAGIVQVQEVIQEQQMIIRVCKE